MTDMKIVDMHCDTIATIRRAGWNGAKEELRQNTLHLDLEKMKKSGYLLQNFALFSYKEDGLDQLVDGMQLADLFFQEMEKNKDLIGIVRSYADIEKNKAAGKMSALLSMEEGAIFKGDISVLRNWYRLGARMMTLTWNYETELAYPNKVEEGRSVPDLENGLKEKGFEFIAEMEKLGIIIDVSHLSDKGFYDIYENTTRPFVASHSNARALCGHSRNLTDDMIRKLADRGGVTGLNYCSAFLADKSPVCYAADIARHARYLANVGGIECVGLGSDFDGIDCELEMKDCSGMQMVIYAFGKEGFSESEIDKILGQNTLRVYKEILK